MLIKRLLLSLILLLTITGVASAQNSTLVTATVKDPAGIAYAFGTYAITFTNATNQQALYGGVPLPPSQMSFSGQLDINGGLSITLPSNAVITPSGTQWTFRICANTGQIAMVFPPPTLPCFSSTQTISGASQPITFTAASIPLNASAVNLTLNQQAGSYSATAADFASCKLITETVASTVTLLNPAPAAGQCITVENMGVGLTGVTIGRNSLTINGAAANVTVNSGQGVTIISDGTNYVLSSGGALGSVPLTPAGAVTITQPNTGAAPLTITQTNGGDAFFILKRSAATIMSVTGVGNGAVNVVALGTVTNCSVNSVSPAACGAAASGSFVVPTTTTAYTVNTTAVSAASRIFLFPHTDTRDLPGAPTCVVPAITAEPVVSGIVAATSFTITIANTTGQTCWDYWIVN